MVCVRVGGGRRSAAFSFFCVEFFFNEVCRRLTRALHDSRVTHKTMSKWTKRVAQARLERFLRRKRDQGVQTLVWICFGFNFQNDRILWETIQHSKKGSVFLLAVFTCDITQPARVEYFSYFRTQNKKLVGPDPCTQDNVSAHHTPHGRRFCCFDRAAVFHLCDL